MAEPVDATDLSHALSAPAETRDVELPKFGGTCEMAIPSQARTENPGREGVETRRAAPKAGGQGEGIVQTTNARLAAAKAEVCMKIRWE